MEKTKKEHGNEVLKEKEWYKQKITEMVIDIDSTWILNQVFKFIKNVSDEKMGGV